jgi:hypothetical protein
MSAPRLYELLPAVHRLADADRGEPLRALLDVIQEQVDVVDDDISRLYANWFVETCDEWVVPYIGELIGYRPVAAAGPPGDVTTAEGQALNRTLVPRREVAGTIGYRRRKGTLALPERLAVDVTGWPARAAEMYRLLVYAQSLNHLHLDRGRVADLRDADALDRLGGAFDEIARVEDVRRISSSLTPGRFDLRAVAVFVWRLRSYSITGAPAFPQAGVAANYYSFSALGNDAPLFTRPRHEAEEALVRDELDVPAPIRPHALERRAADMVGDGLSFEILVGKEREPVAADRVVAADLDDWTYRPRRGFVAVDPARGRIAFHPRELPKGGVWVTYHYGFSTEMGGGEYRRELRERPGATVYRVGPGQPYSRIADALAKRDADQPQDAVIEITHSGVYAEQLYIALARDQTLQLRAAVGARPVVRLLDWQTDLPDSLSVAGENGSRFALDGIVVTGQAVEVQGDLAAVSIRHSTLVPGWGLECDCDPKRPNEPSLILRDTQACVDIEHSIVGSIQVSEDAVGTDPVPIRIADSILDATRRDLEAVSGPPDLPCAHAVLTVERSTIIGGLEVHAIDLAENSIFEGDVHVARRQRGCMRFCSVVPGPELRTPRRHHCQPDLVEAAVAAKYPPGNHRDRQIEEERERVRPEFTSVRYGLPAYCQLALTCAPEILRGADDKSELGAFHDLFNPQRAANLRARLAEYSPAGADADLVYVT